MTRVERLERETETLSAAELEALRSWFADFDAEAWDRQIEEDVASGTLDPIADAAIAEDRSGATRSP